MRDIKYILTLLTYLHSFWPRPWFRKCWLQNSSPYLLHCGQGVGCCRAACSRCLVLTRSPPSTLCARSAPPSVYRSSPWVCPSLTPALTATAVVTTTARPPTLTTTTTMMYWTTTYTWDRATPRRSSTCSDTTTVDKSGTSTTPTKVIEILQRS